MDREWKVEDDAGHSYGAQEEHVREWRPNEGGAAGLLIDPLFNQSLGTSFNDLRYHIELG